MGGFQLSAAWVARGLPLCLAGMTISSSSRVQGSSCHPMPRLQQISLAETEFSTSSENPMESVSFNSRLSENEDQSTANVGSEGENSLQIQPRLALTLEMAEHEHRREAIRNQRSRRRSSNNLSDDSYSNSFTEQNSVRLQDLIQVLMEDPSLELEFYGHTGAKAA